MMDDQVADLGKLLTLEQEIRQSGDLNELSHILCNRSRDMVDFTQSALAVRAASGKMRLIGFSDIAIIDRTAPLATWLEQQINEMQHMQAPFEPTQEAREAVADLVPAHILILPLHAAGKGLLGAFIVTRIERFSEAETSILTHLSGVFAHALAAHMKVPVIDRIRQLVSGRRKWAIAMGLLLGSFIPVDLTAIAPARITASEPFIVAAPMAGVIERVLVKPNQQVESGTALVQMVDVELKNKTVMAQRAFRVAQAELMRARQMAFSSSEGKQQLAELIAQVELRRAEMQFSDKQLQRSVLTAPNAGLVILDDPRKWQGRPVMTGEKIMQLARAEAVEVEVMLPVADAITLSEGSRVDVFLDIDPLNRYRASVTRVPYQSTQTADNFPAYAVRAQFRADTPPPRIGLHGSARLHGPSTSLFYFLFRRPITVLRQLFGV